MRSFPSGDCHEEEFSVRLPLHATQNRMSQPPNPRRVQRRPVTLTATCRTQGGLRDNARIADISQYGCCLRTSMLAMRVGARIVIRPQGLEGVGGVVRWIDGQLAGIEFDSPLYEPVVDHLSRLHAAGDTVGVFAH
jgi:hypothetical protein